MLFDLAPKERLKDLFDRKEEYGELSRLIRSGRWVAVLGKRMTGKTSLVKTFAHENNGIYVNLLGAGRIEEFARRLAAAGGLSLKEMILDLRIVRVKWVRLAEEILGRFRKRIIVLDEVQDIASPRFLKLLKYIWDTYSGIKIVFSGSYIGVMKRLLNPKSASPLYGREPAKLILKPFPADVSRQFLLEGFKQYRRRVRMDEVEEVVQKLNGYVGWLTLYGNLRCVERLNHEDALKKTVQRGSAIIRDELENFLRNRRRDLYLSVLRMTIYGARWSELKNRLNVNSKVLRDILQTLKDVMILDEDHGYYRISDPIMGEAVKRLRIRASQSR